MCSLPDAVSAVLKVCQFCLSQASKAATREGSAGSEAVTQANMAAAYTLVDLSKLQVGSTQADGGKVLSKKL